MTGSLTAAFSVRLLTVRTHRHSPRGPAWVKYKDAVELVALLSKEIEAKYGIKLQLDIPQYIPQPEEIQ